MRDETKQADKIKILLVEDHAMVAQGLERSFKDHPKIRLVGHAKSRPEAMKILRKNVDIDLILMDLSLGKTENHEEPEGLKTIREINSEINDHSAKKIDIIIVTSEMEGKWIWKAFKMKVKGYVAKDDNLKILEQAILDVSQGKRHYKPETLELMYEYQDRIEDIPPDPIRLTPSEKQVLEYISKGLNNNDIAKIRNCKVGTVETHRTNLLRKFGAANAPHMVKMAIEQEII